MEGKSCGMGCVLSSLAELSPAWSKPFLHARANLTGVKLALFVVVKRRPPFFTRGAASATSSSMSFFTLQRFFFFPTLELGGSTITMSNFSPRFASFVSHSKPTEA
jgi:hypothetical protein